MISRNEFEQLKKLPFYKGKIVTDSMVPVINVGESVIVETGLKDLRRFDIVVFYFEGKLICHYLWSVNRVITPLLMQTRNIMGQKDFPVPLEDCLGKVVSHKLPWYRKLKALL